MKYAMATLLVFASASGCDRAQSFLKEFEASVLPHFNLSRFYDYHLTKLKKIHLDTGILQGKRVAVSGQVVELSEHFTYLIMSDDTGRLLVNLTDVDASQESIVVGQQLEILGVLESGPKNLPHLKARIINL